MSPLHPYRKVIPDNPSDLPSLSLSGFVGGIILYITCWRGRRSAARMIDSRNS